MAGSRAAQPLSRTVCHISCVASESDWVGMSQTVAHESDYLVLLDCVVYESDWVGMSV
jgi:hypothetical protein